jgi:PmbA protein
MTTPTPHALAQSLLAHAKKHGATHAEALYAGGRGTSVSYLNGKMDSFSVADEAALGLRVLVGRRQAVAVSGDLSPQALERLAERVCAMAKAAPEDPYVVTADPGQFATNPADLAARLDLADSTIAEAAELKIWAAELEAATLSAKGITKSDGAGASYGRHTVLLLTSSGFEGGYDKTGYGMSVSALAGDGAAMVKDDSYTSARHKADLRPIAHVAAECAARATAKVGARPMALGAVPVVFDRRVAASLVGHFAGAINGENVARGTSFLRDKMGQPVFAPTIRITDDPHRARGLASRPFDGEGLPTAPLDLVSGGILNSWMLDLTTAKRLGLRSTGHAARGTGSLPGPAPTNLLLHGGDHTPQQLIGGISKGLFITALIGHGVNGITGDYSRGAEGFLIENGQLTTPVHEVTVAGNLLDMFATLTPANDIVFDRATVAPTLRVDGMTVAGR